MFEESFNNKYINISYLIQKEFDRNLRKYGEKIKCKKGCSQCCHQIFRITLVDSFVIKNFLNSVSMEQKNYLKDKAKKYINEISLEQVNKDEYFAKPKLPCPALSDDGACMIYDARPIICRRFGPPVYDYKNPEKIFACELNFKNGEEIVDDELIPNQILIGKEWDELKTEFNSEIGSKENASTTIAEAILDC